MPVTSFRIPDKYSNLIKDYIKVTGQTLGDFAVQSMLEKIEDDLDIVAYDEALEENKGEKTYSFEEMKAELDL